jgi:hypothetical protein
MYAGAPIAGDQAGKTITVILAGEAVKPGEEMVFFGNPRFLGQGLTMADEGELPAASATALLSDSGGAQLQTNRAVSDRLAAATVVFRGSVEAVRPLQSEAALEKGGRKTPGSEHDPEWHAATVRVSNALRGDVTTGESVTVVFAASRDIVWFNSPKLKQGQDAVFLARTPAKEEEHILRSSGVEKLLAQPHTYVVTEPFDVLPPAQEQHVRALIAAPKEER